MIAGATAGPSPTVPLLIAGILGLLLYGPILPNVMIFVPESTPPSLLLAVPLTILLAVYFGSDALIAPLILLLGSILVSQNIMGPLILMVLIHVLSVYFLREETNREAYECGERIGFQEGAQVASVGERNIERHEGGRYGYLGITHRDPMLEDQTNRGRYEGERNGWGWGFVWMFLLFLVLYKYFYEGDSYEWGFAWLLGVYIFIYNFC